jgi:TrpR-related protein YerC/YecD
MPIINDKVAEILSLKSNPETRQARVDELFEALLKFKTGEEVQSFLMDLCTPSEIESMADRWCVARLVHQGMSYREIYQRTGVSTATITRIARCVEYGDGYRRLLEKGSSLK